MHGVGLAVMAALVALMSATTSSEAAIIFERMQGVPARVLVLRGEFERSDDPSPFVSEVAAYRPALVTFESPGGNVQAAMRYGRAIRALGLSTMQVRSADCASACTLAFMGGVRRFAEPGAIGVHQSSFASELGIDSQVAVSAVQAMTAEIMTYMIEMGVDPQLLQLSLAVDSSDMRYLTGSEMRQFRVVTQDGAPDVSVPGVEAAVPEPRIVAAPAASAGVDDPSRRALVFLHRYHEAWSSSNADAMLFMRSAYADPVSYYGKSVSLQAVLKEKQAFAKRWPMRAYRMRDGSEMVNCRQVCQIEAVVDWFAKSDERGKTARGASTILIEWDPGSDRIVSERSRVLKAERSGVAPVQLVAQWQDENSACRGGSGDAPATMAACDRRSAIDAKLAKLNWCFGRDGEYGYQHQWHVCGPGSIR